MCVFRVLVCQGLRRPGDGSQRRPETGCARAATVSVVDGGNSNHEAETRKEREIKKKKKKILFVVVVFFCYFFFCSTLTSLQ